MLIIWCLFVVSSLIAMENNNNVAPQKPVIVCSPDSLATIAFHKVCRYLIDENEIVIKNYPWLTAEIREKIESPPIKIFTPALTKKYIFSTITSDHCSMLGFDDQTKTFFLYDIESKQETPLDLCNKKKEQPLFAGLSPSGNLIAAISSKNIVWLQDFTNQEIKIEKKWSGAPPRTMTFIGEEALLIEDFNNHLHCLSVKSLDGMTTDYRYLGVLHKTLEYLTQHESSIVKFQISGQISVTEGKDLEHISKDVPPAIYEPNMLMAYQDDRTNLLHVISLTNNELLAKCHPMPLMLALKITALSFINSQRLMAAYTHNKKAQLAILDWKTNQCLYTYTVENANCITGILCTDQSIKRPSCIFETITNLNSLRCLHSCDPDPIKLELAAHVLKKKIESNKNKNVPKEIDS